MSIDSFEAFGLVVAFIMPGFICETALGAVVPRAPAKKELYLIRFITWSAINYAIWLWPLFHLLRGKYFDSHPVRAIGLWILIVLVSPILLGLAIGWIQQRSVIDKSLQRLGLRTIQPDPTAWDHFFSRTKPVWVMAKLRGGHKVAGFFGSKSYAASDEGGRDLYLETVCQRPKAGAWRKVSRSGGIWLNGKDIVFVEMWKDRPNEREARQGETE